MYAKTSVETVVIPSIAASPIEQAVILVIMYAKTSVETVTIPSIAASYWTCCNTRDNDCLDLHNCCYSIYYITFFTFSATNRNQKQNHQLIIQQSIESLGPGLGQAHVYDVYPIKSFLTYHY
jgi:predicted Na+-dependent transporter